MTIVVETRGGGQRGGRFVVESRHVDVCDDALALQAPWPERGGEGSALGEEGLFLWSDWCMQSI